MKFINKLSILALLLILCLSFIFLAVSEGSESVRLNGNEYYNVVLIIISVLRPDHLGCCGYQKQTSLAIDDIAKDSCIFENAFSQSGYTLASTMSIFTSLYPSSHGILYVFKDILSPRVQTMAEIFNLYNYKTAWFSLLKTPHLDIDVGFGRGFQDKVELGILFNGRNELLSWLQKNKTNKFFLAIDARRVHNYYWFLNDSPQVNKKPYATVEEVNKAFYHKMVKLAKSRKFPLDDPKIFSEHRELLNGKYNKEKPDQVKQLVDVEKREELEEIRNGLYVSWVRRSASKDSKAWIAAYDACIQATDKELIKPIADELKALGLYDKTMLVITADHGEAFGEHGLYGHGYALFDEFNHVPLIIKMPYAKEGKRIKELAQSIDIMPTILEMAGIEVPHQAQGKSLVSLMNGANTSPLNEYIFAEIPQGKSIRSQEWKLLVNSNGEKDLFHIRLDPQERHNVYSTNKPIAKKLEAELKKWESSLVSYKDKEYPFATGIDKAGQERIRKTGYW
jgi:arylsulfatase A-like enzyme